MKTRQLVRPRRETCRFKQSLWLASLLISLSPAAAFQPGTVLRSSGTCRAAGNPAGIGKRRLDRFRLPPPIWIATDPEVLMSQTHGDDEWTDADRKRIEILYALAAAAEKDGVPAPVRSRSAETIPNPTTAVNQKATDTDRNPSSKRRKPLKLAARASRSGRVKFRGLSTTSSKAKYQHTSKHSSQRKSGPVSTMPGFNAESGRQRAYRESVRLVEKKTGRKIMETPKERQKRRAETGESMYRNSASVPESLVQFAGEIHQEDRITRQEEIELGEKTQEAIRIHHLYDNLEEKLAREPTDEEWCAAAGKINMEAVRQTIEEGLEAKNKLVTSNLRLVQSVVNTYIRNGLSAKYNAADMMQEGIVALIRAAEKFEPDRGWRFSTYAMYWVRASVKRNQVSQSRTINVPHRLHDNHKRLMKIEHEMSVQLNRKPTLKELAQASDMSEVQVERCFDAIAQRCYSLDQEIQNSLKPMNDSGRSDTLIDILDSKAEDTEEKKLSLLLLREDLIETLNRHLSPEEVEILLFRYGLKNLPEDNTRRVGGQPTIAELSRAVGYSPDKVRRMIKKALKQLRATDSSEWRSLQQDLL